MSSIKRDMNKKSGGDTFYCKNAIKFPIKMSHRTRIWGLIHALSHSPHYLMERSSDNCRSVSCWGRSDTAVCFVMVDFWFSTSYRQCADVPEDGGRMKEEDGDTELIEGSSCLTPTSTNKHELRRWALWSKTLSL